jgi:thioredoxin reductase (NADPH)
MKPEIILYGADWCPDCVRAKKYLKDNDIDYQFIDVDLDKAATKLVEKINKGKRIIPTIIIDGKTYTNPDNAKLAAALGLNPQGQIDLYGADWCPDCRRAKAYLQNNGINYRYIEVDNHEWASKKVIEINKGKRIIPTIIIDEMPYTNPNNAVLKEVLNIEAQQNNKVYDVIIVGGGAAGLTTSIYAQRDRFDTLILEKKNIGGNAFLTQKIENYPGFTNISGPKLMEKMSQQAETYGAKIETGVEVTEIKKEKDVFQVQTNLGPYQGRSVLLAVGSTYRKLGIPGEESLIGAGIHFCATCDGAFYRDQEVVVIGGGNSALEEGIFLAGFTKKVKIIHHKAKFDASETYVEKLPSIDNIETHLDKTAVEFVENEAGTFYGVKIKDNQTGKEEIITADGAFIFIGLIPNTNTFKELIDLNERGFIKTTGMGNTSVAGIFAAGDVREGAIAQVAAATGEGVLASYGIKEYLKA